MKKEEFIESQYSGVLRQIMADEKLRQAVAILP
jgi:hypothetical protein